MFLVHHPLFFLSTLFFQSKHPQIILFKMKALDMRPPSKSKKIQLWKRAILHVIICFITGFFSGFTPATTTSLFTFHHQHQKLITYDATKHTTLAFQEPPQTSDDDPPPAVVNRSLMAEIPAPAYAVEVEPPRLLIMVTTTTTDNEFLMPQLMRLAQTLQRAPPPVLWVVVGRQTEAAATAEVLRGTGVMYRHLTYKENFTDGAAEVHHQRNVALGHIEYHRLTGIVHFAGASNVYEKDFFDEIRQIETFGAWPVAMVALNRKRVMIDGPICRSSKVVGWLLKDLSNEFTDSMALNSAEVNAKPSKINISGFAFNSSILWDPERWGRSTSLPDTSQDSFKFVEDVILEDETKLKGIPANCSKIMLWNLYIPRAIDLPFHQHNKQT